MKWVGIVLASLAGILALAMIVVYAISARRISKVYSFDDPPLNVPTDAVSIVKGQHFVQAIGKCANCHGDNLAGKVVFNDKIMGRLYSANLTRGKGGIGSSFTASRQTADLCCSCRPTPSTT
jgi:mono/diheme cytochrome c family protein